VNKMRKESNEKEISAKQSKIKLIATLSAGALGLAGVAGYIWWNMPRNEGIVVSRHVELMHEETECDHTGCRLVNVPDEWFLELKDDHSRVSFVSVSHEDYVNAKKNWRYEDGKLIETADGVLLPDPSTIFQPYDEQAEDNEEEIIENSDDDEEFNDEELIEEDEEDKSDEQLPLPAPLNLTGEDVEAEDDENNSANNKSASSDGVESAFNLVVKATPKAEVPGT